MSSGGQLPLPFPTPAAATPRQRAISNYLIQSGDSKQASGKTDNNNGSSSAQSAKDMNSNELSMAMTPGCCESNLVPKPCPPPPPTSPLVSDIEPHLCPSINPTTLDCQRAITPNTSCVHPSKCSLPNESNGNNKLGAKNVRQPKQQAKESSSSSSSKKRDSSRTKTCNNGKCCAYEQEQLLTCSSADGAAGVSKTSPDLVGKVTEKPLTTINPATSMNRHSSPNLFAHYHHHHIFPGHNQPHHPQFIRQQQSQRTKDLGPTSHEVLPCSLVTSLTDTNELQNSIVRPITPTTTTTKPNLSTATVRKLSHGTISWDSSLSQPSNCEDLSGSKHQGGGIRRRAKAPKSTGNDVRHHHHLQQQHMPNYCQHHQTGHFQRHARHRCPHQQHSSASIHRKNSSGSIFSAHSSQFSRQTSLSTNTLSFYKRCWDNPNTRRLVNGWTRSQAVLQKFVNHNYFQQAIFLAILLNTLAMGIEYHNQPESLSRAVEISNIIFTAIFGVEMLLKLLADGFYDYIQSGFNVFDGSIVIISLLELLEHQDGNGGGGSSGLSVLRTFRLLRILKLVRFMPALRRQLVIMLRTIDNVAVFFALLILFIFIFR